MLRYLGIDVGAESLKIAELLVDPSGRSTVKHGRCVLLEHHEDPAAAILGALADLDWSSVAGAAATGRFGTVLNLERIPVKAAQLAGLDCLLPGLGPVTVVAIGSRGFSVLERRPGGATVFRENNRCSQGTGNFLAQLVARLNLTVEQASELCADVAHPAVLSGRCPVILKTDMTHLANKGESHERILAGLFDAVAENVEVLLKPNLAPPRVLLAGGVCRARRIRERFRTRLPGRGMELLEPKNAPADLLFLEAFGAASEAALRSLAAPSLSRLVTKAADTTFHQVPSLRAALAKVTRLTRPPLSLENTRGPLVLGFDIGSTGSKVVALDLHAPAGADGVVWESYLNTSGDPVAAARSLLQRFVDAVQDRHPVVAVAATGSGREIVGSLLTTCFGAERVFVLNEIAAHAAGALHCDPTVDTIFEIGGQDAKYIRLADGQVFDAAMNEACSAGTGSFIEEQGKKFAEVGDIVQMSQVAMGADCGVSLGQHCSVFMAEVIDSAVGAGKAQETIVAGIYDSIVQNYLNRVKGNRSIGERIFCQGMPFSGDALASAVAQQTGRDVVVPPNPGTVGALGIALLAKRELPLEKDAAPLDVRRFLSARVLSKDKLICPSTKGCGEPGNRCSIDRLTTVVGDEQKKFLWGGHCSLYDKGGHNRTKLPDLAPHPFKERRELLEEVIAATAARGGRPTVGLSDEFLLKCLFPFFATFVRELGFDPVVKTDADQRVLKRGIGEANVPYCAPVQLFNGVVQELADCNPDFLLVPMMRDLPRPGELPISSACPVSQASPDLVRLNIAGRLAQKGTTLLTPTIDMGHGNLKSQLFIDSAERLAQSLGAGKRDWKDAWAKGVLAQEKFDRRLTEIGREALAFCKLQDIVPVVVLGRPYTIHNQTLNANVPNILRELGAIGIPVDCYPVDEQTPTFSSMYWGHSQPNIRAAHQVRRNEAEYAIFCSTYSCGPDSFDLHFFSYLMEGKPFAVIESDGHSGDAGTKTRVEAFLSCVTSDRRAGYAAAKRKITDFARIEAPNPDVSHVRGTDRILLLPRMGPTVPIAAAGLRAEGLKVECLPEATREVLRVGRRYTSGKECIPAVATLAGVLHRIEQGDPSERYAFFMPAAAGPCRQGVYNIFDKIVFEKLGLGDRLVVVSQPEHDFFKGLGKGPALRMWAAIVAADFLREMLHDVQPVEKVAGTARALHDDYFARIIALLEASPGPTLWGGLKQVPFDLFGLLPMVKEAAARFAAAKDETRDIPTVLLVGETYVRIDPNLNDFIIDRLQRRGIRTRMVPFLELMEYSDWENYRKFREGRFEVAGSWLSEFVSKEIKLTIVERLYAAVAKPLAWSHRCRVTDSVAAAEPYLNEDLYGEAVVTVGGAVHEYLSGSIVGAINVGPTECMPTKVAEAQFFHVAEKIGLATLTVTFNGDPLSADVIDNFAYEVHAKHKQNQAGRAKGTAPARPQPRLQVEQVEALRSPPVEVACAPLPPPPEVVAPAAPAPTPLGVGEPRRAGDRPASS